MADTKISALTGYTTPLDADVVPVVDTANTTTKKTTWANIKATLKTYLDTLYQPLDSDLTTIAGLTATTDNFIQAKSSAWASRTVAQVKTDLGLTGTNSGDETTSTLGATINGATAAVPNDTDLVATVDTSVVKKITWTNVKAFLKTYFDTVYAQLAGSVSQAFAVSQLEVGHASDTTLARVSAGVLSVEGVTIPSISSTNTLTNKRVTPRVGTTTSSATPTINTDNVDYYSLTAQAADITSFTTNLSGTPTDGQKLWISITGTAARAITWGTSFEASTIALPTTTVSTNRLDVGFVWNTATSKWRCIGSV